MPKTYVLDTNVLLHDPRALFVFEEHRVVIPLAVIEEIDNQKKRQDEIGRNARTVSRILDSMRAGGPLSSGVALPKGGELMVELNHQEAIVFPKGLDPHKPDNRILALALNLSKENSGPVIVVTKDLNLRIKADVMGIIAEDLHSDKVDYQGLYQGFCELYVPGEALISFYAGNTLNWDQEPLPNPHEFCILRNSENPSQSALCRYFNKTLQPLRNGETATWGISGRNKEQKFAMELLLDDTIPLVTLVGSAGTGKTLLALAVGLHKVIEERIYDRFLIMRPVVPMGDDLGYLPGTKEEKLRPWMQPIYDNLDFLFRGCSDSKHLLDDFLRQGTIEMETLTHIRGRSIPNQFILCDEAQNLSPNMVKALVTRIGEGTKLILTGDPEQIDHPYLDADSNGLTYLVEKLKAEKISGHVMLTKGERSRVAELAARLL
jgi:PhoH-like ATPase